MSSEAFSHIDARERQRLLADWWIHGVTRLHGYLGGVLWQFNSRWTKARKL